MIKPPPHPGSILKNVLNGISDSDAAHRVGLSREHLNNIKNGKKSITAETALKLERAFCDSHRYMANDWMQMQADYDLWNLRKQNGLKQPMIERGNDDVEKDIRPIEECVDYVEIIREIGRKLKEIREEMGLSENEASNNIGISTRDLKNIESGKNVDAYLLIRIIPMFADDYNVPLDYLFGLSDESNVVDRRLPVNKYIPKDADLDVLKSVLRSEFYTYKNMTCRMYKNEMIISKYLNVFLKTVSLLRLVRNDADCLLKTDVESEKSTGIIRKLDAVLSFQRDIERVIKGSSLGRYVDV